MQITKDFITKALKEGYSITTNGTLKAGKVKKISFENKTIKIKY